MRAKNRRSQWSREHTPGISDPPPEHSSSDGDNGPAKAPKMSPRRAEDDRDLVSQAIDIIKSRNDARYGIFDVDENYVRSLSHEQLLMIVTVE